MFTAPNEQVATCSVRIATVGMCVLSFSSQNWPISLYLDTNHLPFMTVNGKWVGMRCVVNVLNVPVLSKRPCKSNPRYVRIISSKCKHSNSACTTSLTLKHPGDNIGKTWLDEPSVWHIYCQPSWQIRAWGLLLLPGCEEQTKAFSAVLQSSVNE